MLTELAEAHHHIEEVKMSPVSECRVPQPQIVNVEDPKKQGRILYPSCTVIYRCRNDSGCCGPREECGPKTERVVFKTFMVSSYLCCPVFASRVLVSIIAIQCMCYQLCIPFPVSYSSSSRKMSAFNLKWMDWAGIFWIELSGRCVATSGCRLAWFGGSVSVPALPLAEAIRILTYLCICRDLSLGVHADVCRRVSREGKMGIHKISQGILH